MAKAKVAKGSKQSKRLDVTDTKLKTEKDGRLFAVQVLEKLRDANADEAAIYPYAIGYEYGEEIEPYRYVGQWPGFYRDLRRLIRSGNDEAVKGFASIFTDALAADIGMNLSVYRKLEREGKLLPFGTTSDEYPLPDVRTKKQTAALAKKEKRDTAKSLEAADRAQQPDKTITISRTMPETIESFLQNSGETRRVATAFLTRPYDDMAREVKRDKKTAEAIAAAAAGLGQIAGQYLTIGFYLEQALRNMKCAVRARKDGEKLLKVARSKQRR